jgi:hypothetical protein
MVSEVTRSPKSQQGEFLHVFSSEFLTKEEIERNETCFKKKNTSSRGRKSHDFVDDPKIVSMQDKQIQNERESCKMTFVRDSDGILRQSDMI